MDILAVAKLANLSLTPEETSAFGQQMEKILVYVSRLQTAAKGNMVATSQTTELKNVSREDENGETLKLHNPEFIVPAVLSNE